MSASRTITIHLEPEEYERLQQAARRRGMRPTFLVREFVRSRLDDDDVAREERRRQGLEALERAKAFQAELRRAGYPSVDVVKLVREGREELERRTAEQWP
jgi:predicted DNA-binding protein